MPFDGWGEVGAIIMRIEKLNIKNFGKFSEKATSFSPGINIIKGANEAGKSTLVEAISTGLFDDVKMPDKSLKEKFKWGEGGASVQLEVSDGEKKFNLNKDFFAGVQTLRSPRSKEGVESSDGWMKFLEDKLGITDKGLFHSTACIRQDEMDRISSSPETMRDKLESIITGAKEETVAGEVIEQLSERIEQIKGSDTASGILRHLEEEAEDLKYEIGKLTRELEVMEGKRKEFIELSSRHKSTAAEYEEKQKLLERWETAATISRKKSELQSKYDELKGRIDELSKSQGKVIDFRKQIADKPEINKSDIDTVDELEVRIRYLGGKRSDSENDRKILEQSLEEGGGTGLLFFLNVLNFIMIFVCAAAGFMYQPIIAAGSGLFVLTQIVLIILLWRRSAERTALNSQIRFVERRLEEVRAEIISAKETTNKILRKYKLKNTSDLRSIFSFVDEIQKNIDEEAARYERLLDGGSLKSLQDKLKSIGAEIDDLTAQSEKLGTILPDAASFEKLRMEVEQLNAENIKLKEKTNALKQQLELFENGGENLIAFKERLEYNLVMYQRYSRRLKVYQVTASFIEKARRDILKATAETLEDKVGKYLSRITAGKYGRVRFDRSNLDFSVFSTEKQDWINSKDNLSRGLIDQIYFCARLVLIDLIAEENKPFIILDDPFVHFDPERALRAIEILKDISADYQILLFTNSGLYDHSADNIIQL